MIWGLEYYSRSWDMSMLVGGNIYLIASPLWLLASTFLRVKAAIFIAGRPHFSDLPYIMHHLGSIFWNISIHHMLPKYTFLTTNPSFSLMIFPARKTSILIRDPASHVWWLREGISQTIIPSMCILPFIIAFNPIKNRFHSSPWILIMEMIFFDHLPIWIPLIYHFFSPSLQQSKVQKCPVPLAKSKVSVTSVESDLSEWARLGGLICGFMF